MRILVADKLADEGLEAYVGRRFEAAAECFERILARRPHDRPATALLERCRGLQLAPPPPEWDGVHVLTEK